MTEDKKPEFRQAVPDSNSNDQNKKVLKIVLIALAVLIVLGAIGTLALGIFFTKGIEHALEQSTGSNIEINSDDSFTAQSKLPKDFPEEIPLFTEGELIASRSQQKEEGKNFLVTFKSDAEPETIRDFYEQELTAGDWKITSTTKANNNVSYVAEREDLRISINIVPTEKESETHYTITADRES